MNEYEITSEELKKILDNNPSSIKLLDVREPEEYAEDRLEPCTLIPLGDLMSRAESELDRKDNIIVYCAHGVRSMHALMGLKSLGFENVKSLTGGICAYRERT